MRLLAGRVGDGAAEIVRACLRGACRRPPERRERRFYEHAGGVLHASVWDLIRFGIDEFHISNGIGSVLNGAGYTLVALAAEPHGPFRRGACANGILPLYADFREIVGPNKRR